MFKEIKTLYTAGYTFVIGSTYGDSIENDFEEIEDYFNTYSEDKLSIEVDHSAKEVYIYVNPWA